MKILIVAERENLVSQINLHFRPHGSEVIHYRSPIKAMDNIDEVDPDLTLFSAQDFPRHWKTFLSFLRNNRSKEESVYILLKGDDFPFEEAAKAHALGANGIVHENLAERRELDRLKRLVERYKSLAEGRKSKRLVPDENDNICFVFTSPVDFKIVTGEVIDISADGLSFHADNDDNAKKLEVGSSLPGCSLRIGDEILSPDCTIVKKDHYLHIQFSQIPEQSKAILADYLEAHTIREIKKAQAAGVLTEAEEG